MQNWKLTKDKPRMGPPLGGAICFTLQATGLVYEPQGIMSLTCLFAALVIGTTAGWLVEEAITRVIAPMRKRCTTPNPAHIGNQLDAEVPYTDRRPDTGND